MDHDDSPLDQQQSKDDGHFLSRWSDRKLASEQPLVQQPEPEPLQEQPCDEDMPPLDSLSESSDYTGFLSPKVSETLRKMALRKLFHGSDFNLCDGLDDYDEDFTTFQVLGDVITADLHHQMELEEQREAEQQVLAEEQAVEPQVEEDSRSDSQTEAQPEAQQDTGETGDDDNREIST
ncbi:MAG: DUF3306 domain-containing protein [Candidatus Thiodiazotropha sp.]|jgi:hypothetical protein